MVFLQINTPVQCYRLHLCCDQSSIEVHSKVVPLSGLVSTAFPDPRQFVEPSFRYDFELVGCLEVH